MSYKFGQFKREENHYVGQFKREENQYDELIKKLIKEAHDKNENYFNKKKDNNIINRFIY